MSDQHKSPSNSLPPIVGWLVALALALVMASAAIHVWQRIEPKPPGPQPGPQPGPVDPVDPDDDGDDPQPINVDDEIEAAAELSILHAEDQAEQCRRAKLRSREEVDHRLHGAFEELDSILDATPEKKFPAVLASLSTGFRTGGKRVSDRSVQRYATALAGNFEDAAKLLGRLGEQKATAKGATAAKEISDAISKIHFKLQQTNTAAKSRLIDAIVTGRAGVAFSGYLIDQEAREKLKATSTPLPLMSIRAPPEMRPQDWHHVEDQGSMGSCQGHALSSVCEMAYRIALGDFVRQYRAAQGEQRVIVHAQAKRYLGSLFDAAIRSRSDDMQFSRLFCYYASQKRDGILGSDCGSTLAGGLAAASKDGLCPEAVMPYPNPVVYTARFSQGAYEAAKDFRIRRHTVCKNYADVLAFLSSGQGGVEIGIRWGNGMMECPDGRIERYDSSGGGGHAVCFLGYSTTTEPGTGRKYLWLANSWGERWGNRGYAEVSPSAVDAMARHPETVMIGLSDLDAKNIHPRDVSWIGKGSVF